MNRFVLFNFGLVLSQFVLCCADKPTSEIPTRLPALPSQAVTEGMDTPQLAADLARAEEEARKLADRRSIKEREFTLVVDATKMAGVKQLHVDIVSTDTQNATEIVAGGFSKYRDNRSSGSSTLKHVFHNGGVATLQVPTITPAESLVLWVDLPKPTGGDSRLIHIPLKLDLSTPGNPLAKPITVSLSPKGWTR